MHRAVEMLGGGILGFIAGSFLCAPLLAHVFGPTTVTWDTSACPSGIYTITSTATSVENGRAYTTTTAHLRLPHGSLVQEFSDLPSGQYVVTAVARDARGKIFNSDSQNIFGVGSAHAQRAVQPAASVQTSRAAATARAIPVTAAAPALSAPATRVAAAAPAPVGYPLTMSGSMAEFLQSRSQGESGLLAMSPNWKSVMFVDVDGDGVIDEVRIELTTGEVWVVNATIE